MKTEDKVLENRMRRTARRRGYQLERSRAKDPKALGYGGYLVRDLRTKRVVAGGGAFPYSLTLADVVMWMEAE